MKKLLLSLAVFITGCAAVKLDVYDPNTDVPFIASELKIPVSDIKFTARCYYVFVEPGKEHANFKSCVYVHTDTAFYIDRHIAMTSNLANESTQFLFSDIKSVTLKKSMDNLTNEQPSKSTPDLNDTLTEQKVDTQLQFYGIAPENKDDILIIKFDTDTYASKSAPKQNNLEIEVYEYLLAHSVPHVKSDQPYVSRPPSTPFIERYQPPLYTPPAPVHPLGLP